MVEAALFWVRAGGPVVVVLAVLSVVSVARWPRRCSVCSAPCSGAVLVRIAGNGTPFIARVPLSGPPPGREVARRLAGHPGAPVLILPSARASVQSLVDVLGALAASGATAVEIVRFASRMRAEPHRRRCRRLARPQRPGSRRRSRWPSTPPSRSSSRLPRQRARRPP
jgi:hypothetical protein